MKNNKFIVGLINNKWSRLVNELGDFKVNIACLLYETVDITGSIFKIDSKIYVHISGKTETTKKTFADPSLEECISFMKSLYEGVNNKYFDIFKFSSDSELELFNKWFIEKESKMLSVVDKI